MSRFLLRFFVFAMVFAYAATPAFSSDESVYHRVMRTKTIRCGYLPYEPFVSKDLITGELSGVTVDYVNEVSRNLGLKVEWAGEVNIDQVVPAVNAGRFDMFCLPATPDLNWEKVLEFVGDMGALPYFVYVGINSTITEEELKTAIFTTVDGYALTEITNVNFPDAVLNQLPQTASTAEMYDQIRYGKGDAIVNEHISAMNYMLNNPGIIRRHSDKPLIAMKMFLTTKKGDTKMADFVAKNFDANNGENLELMKSLLEKYNVKEGALLLGDECPKSIVTEDKRERICVLP